MHPSASPLVTFGIGGLAVFIAVLSVLAIRKIRPAWTTRAAVGVGIWMLATAGIASTGVVRNFDARPPPFAFVFLAVFALGVGLGLSRVGKAIATLPLWMLVLVHGFRLPLELVMHAAAVEGTMPNVMSYSGLNFDIVTGVLAIVVGIALRFGAPRILAAIWIVLAFVTLAAVVTIAVLASPLFLAFGPNEINTWVTYVPFVWLPTVLVVAALAGQIVVVRALRS